MRPIKYNSQRDNFDFQGTFKGNKQCFSTCAWMFLSYFIPAILGDNDNGLAKYVDDVEVKVGTEPSIAEEVFKESGFSSFWWSVQKVGIQRWLDYYLTGKTVIFENLTESYSSLSDIIKKSPIILGTNKMGGLSGGHIILLTDRINDGFFVHDPYGNATTLYVDHNGSNVFYSDSFLTKYSIFGQNNRVRFMYAV